jgi:amidophosphoribosyltransferase
MCGVFGVISKEPVSARLIKGAERLQNRGERSTKVVTYDDGFFYNHGGLMPPAFLFLDYDHQKLRGNSGITHTRYATTGGNDLDLLERNIQPVFSARPGMALCNNGDLINMRSMTERLKKSGFSFQSQVDAKVIQNTLILHMMKKRFYKEKGGSKFANAMFDSVSKVHHDLVGAYAALALMDQGLLAFKDPRGIRPLCMAERRNGWGEVVEIAFASESSVFNYFGDYKKIEELQPGEAVFVEHDTLTVHRKKLVDEQEAFCFFEYVYFARPDSRFNEQYVEVIRQDMGRVMAEQCADYKDKLDVVCGLPGTAVSAGQTFAQELGLPVKNMIIKTGTKRSFQETSDEKRKKAIDDKFIFIRDFIDGQRVGIVDDSNVRGTTAKKIVRRLYDLGAKEVHMFYYTPPIMASCFYGIDTPDQNRLIAYNRTNEEIREQMGCDTVTYITTENLIKGLRHPKESLCLACISGCYPTDMSEVEERINLRKEHRGEIPNGHSGC